MSLLRNLSPFVFVVFLFSFVGFTAGLVPIGGASCSVAPNAGSAPAGAQSIFCASISHVVQPGANITVAGNLFDASNFSQSFNPGSVNVTAHIEATGVNFSQITGGMGFAFNVTAPVLPSSGRSYLPYILYLTTNTTTPAHNKSLEVYVTNATNVSFIFVNTFPPFATNRNFTVTISYFNGTNAINNDRPLVEIFKLNGARQAWTLTNLTATTNAQGQIQYNVTVPSDASGQYALVVDKGAGFLIFGIRSTFTTSIGAFTLNEERRTAFARNARVNLYTAVRYDNGTAYNLVSADSAIAFVTLPNGTIVNFSMGLRNTTTHPGVVNVTFNQTGLVGTYNVRTVVTIGTTSYEAFGFFTVSSLVAFLEIPSSMFDMYEGKQAMTPNQTVRFDIIVENTTTDNIIQGNSTGATSGSPNVVRCQDGNLTFVGFTNVVDGSNATNFSQMRPVYSTVDRDVSTTCSISVSVPDKIGIFRLFVNVTSPDQTEVMVASTIVRVETLALGVALIQAANDNDPGTQTFFTSPGKVNATFRITARNRTSRDAVPVANIQNMRVLSITPLSFRGAGAGQFNNFTENNTANCNPCGNNPNPALPYHIKYPNSEERRVLVNLPNQGGFFVIEFEANVSGQFVTGSTVFMAKNVEAFAFPKSEAVQGHNFDFGMSKCNVGNQTFQIDARDIESGQPAQGVQLEGILEAGDFLGENILPLIHLGNRSSTDAEGRAFFNVSIDSKLNPDFRSRSFFMRFNVTYRGAQDEAFGMLNCQGRRLFLMPNPFFAQLSPDQMHAVTYSSIFGDDTAGMLRPIVNGTLELLSITAFPETKGEHGDIKKLAPTVRMEVNITDGQSMINIFPANFSLRQWPFGFLRLELNVTNGTLAGQRQGPSYIIGGMTFSGADPGGFLVSPFQAFVPMNQFDFSAMPPRLVLVPGAMPIPVTAGEPVSIFVNATTNVSTSGNNITVFFDRFDAHTRVRAQVLAAVRVIDAWNTTADTQLGRFEQWNVTFRVPTTLPAGDAGVIVVVNNTKGVEVETFTFTQIEKFRMQLLSQDQMIVEGHFCEVTDNVGQNGNFSNCLSRFGPPFNYSNATHMNLSVLNASYSVASLSNRVCLKREFNFTAVGLFMAPGMEDATALDHGSIIVVLDNVTQNVYDTVVINTSNGTQQIIRINNFTSAQRRIVGNTNTTYSAYYLANLFGCGRIGLVNGTVVQGAFSGEPPLGEFGTNARWYAPFRLLRSGAPVSPANATIVGFVEKDVEGRITGTLTASQFTAAPSQTDAQGVVFVEANVTRAGHYSAIWDINTTIGGTFISDRASTFQDHGRQGGGQGGTVDIVGFRLNCPQGGRNNAYYVPAANSNVSYACSVSDFDGRRIANATVQVNLRRFEFSQFGSGQMTRTAAKLFNATGGSPTFLNTSNESDVTINFTHPTGWPCNTWYDIESNVTYQGASQLGDAGSAGLFCQTG